jgi:hypothetical protein
MQRRAMVRSTHRRVDILSLRSSSHCSFVTGHRFPSRGAPESSGQDPRRGTIKKDGGVLEGEVQLVEGNGKVSKR